MSSHAMDVAAGSVFALIVLPFVFLVWGFCVRFFLDWWRDR